MEKADLIRSMDAKKEEILALPNVIGIGIGYKVTGGVTSDQLCIVVLVSEKKPLIALGSHDVVPRSLDGFLTDVREIGKVTSLQNQLEMWRPAPPGVSLGHYLITTGTFGCVVYDRSDGSKLILSNNHVIANTNDAAFGDRILQPGAFDGGTIGEHTLASLERFIPIRFSAQESTCKTATFVGKLLNQLADSIGSHHQVNIKRVDRSATNLVDAAVARPYQENLVSDEILQIGAISGTEAAVLNKGVRKFGRTTAYTTGTIIVVDATVNVNYGEERNARFERQILTTPMSEGGDSGSLLVSLDSPMAVGLLFAGSSQVSIHNPIETVLNLLDVSMLR